MTEREMTDVGSFTIPFNQPVLYSKSCRDYNPIHLSALAGKYLFGMGGKIAHGMTSVALVAEMSRREERTRKMAEIWWSTQEPWSAEVSFKRPVVLPSTLSLRISREEGKKIHFEVVGSGRGENKIYTEGWVQSM
eukprot:TRINITY_DN6033_c0_g1_i1.p2 TRINITY_DN6033_c0_g1~~TRINITY_DN6033_c0_g1_i1.p2  ORF type:complete len:135 (+),score=50.50 TRINITY_DN6033_c0_g1_i1:831-1235(+)